MPEDKLMMLWIGAGALALLLVIVFWVLLYAVVRAAFLSALRTHSREQRRQFLRTGAVDIVAAQTGAVVAAPQTGAVGAPPQTRAQGTPAAQPTGPITSDTRDPAPATRH